MTVDLTGESPPATEAREMQSTKASPICAQAIAPIFLRQGSQYVEPGAKDSSGYTPLTFCMPSGTMSKWWTHELYRGPGGKKVKVEYCGTKEEMENVAKTYLKEPVVGFDMEWWPKAGGIKGNISLIQIGVEDRIALFHIAMFKGNTIEQLVSPSLRKLVECPNIIKTGSAVYAADGRRLKRFMHLEPRGFLELGQLHRVVMFANSKPLLVNNAGWALAKQVRAHFGIPMSKGPVRCSNWTKKLTPEQIVYAASDAYAGYMLYRVMELKRVSMDPVPPRPAFAELFLKVRATMTEAIAHIPASTPHAIHRPEMVEPTSDTLADRMYEALRIRRKWFAKKEDVPAYAIALNVTLAALVEARPSNMEELAQLKGMTVDGLRKYGSEWLRIVKSFSSEEDKMSHENFSTRFLPASNHDTSRQSFRRPVSLTPSPQSSSAAPQTTMSAARLPITTNLPAVSEADARRAMSALRALRIRLSMQKNLPRDFVSDDFLQHFAHSVMTGTHVSIRSPELHTFHIALQESDVNLEQFLQKHVPRLHISRSSSSTMPTAHAFSCLSTHQLGMPSDIDRTVSSSVPINLSSSDRTAGVKNTTPPRASMRPMKAFARSAKRSESLGQVDSESSIDHSADSDMESDDCMLHEPVDGVGIEHR